MANEPWPTRPHKVVALQLDAKNPRLGRETMVRAPREILQHLFDHDKAGEIAESIATRGFFPNEPLLAVIEDKQPVVVEGNRRLAALKALIEPGLLEGPIRRKVERLARRVGNIESIKRVPVTIAPSRRATDQLIAGRHVGNPVLPWQAENRASFILDKIAEDYTNDELRDELGFTEADIQNARQTRAIAEMARSLDLAPEVKAKLENPRARVFSTVARVFESTVGRSYLLVEPDPNHGIRGRTTKQEFVKGFRRLVSDIALGKQSSRTLHSNDDMKDYFESLPEEDRVRQKRGNFLPADLITEPAAVAALAPREDPAKQTRSTAEVKTVVPGNLKVRVPNPRLLDIRRELARLKRADFPNAGAVLLRVFFELTVLDYLRRTGRLDVLIEELTKQRKNHPLPYNTPKMSELVPDVVEIAKKHLSAADARMVEKAVRYDKAAPFTISDLHGFVHSNDLPSERDIQQFWMRTEPLFRFMLDDKMSAPKT